MKPMTAAGVALLAALAGPLPAAHAALPWTEQTLAGTYETRVCASAAQWGTGALTEAAKYFRRTYTFDAKDQATARYTFFADAACERPLFSGLWSLTYQAGPVSPSVPTARLVDTQVRSQRLTLLSPEMLPLVQKQCGAEPWVLGVERDVSREGCLGIGLMYAPITPQSADFDIIAVDDQQLMVGFRTPDMRYGPQGRPTRLQADLPALRVK